MTVDPISPETIELEFVAKIRSVDLALLVDTTGSMVQELDTLRATLRDRIHPGLLEVVPDLRLSLAQVTDFEGEGGTSGTLFRLHASSTDEPAALQAAVESAWREHGGDGPEGQVVALWLTATGEGFDRGLVLPVPPRDCPARTVGYPCFASRGARLALLYTDATFHNGPRGEYPYAARFDAPSYADMLAAMREIGARAVGIYSGAPGAEGEEHLSTLARDTRAIDLGGRPIVVSVGRAGERLAEGTVTAVRTFIDEAPLDVELVLEHPADEGRSALHLVSHVETAGASPAGGATEDGRRFLDVRPGTLVRFRIVFRPDDLGPMDAGRVYRLAAVLRMDSAVELERRLIEIVIGRGDAVCPGAGP